MTGVFVSYRRNDSSGWAGNLARDLAKEFGKGTAFFDIDSLEPGVDFVDAIERRVGLADVVLVVIGPHWLTAVDKSGGPRLNDPTDVVHMEIAAALKRDVPVVPVLVGGAAMPSASELPQDLASLARRQAHELSDRRWDYDLGELAKYLRKVITPKRFQLTRSSLLVLAAFASAIGILAAYYPADTDPAPDTDPALDIDKDKSFANFVCKDYPGCADPYTTRFALIRACWPEAGVPAGTLMFDFILLEEFAEQRRTVAECLGL